MSKCYGSTKGVPQPDPKHDPPCSNNKDCLTIMNMGCDYCVKCWESLFSDKPAEYKKHFFNTLNQVKKYAETLYSQDKTTILKLLASTEQHFQDFLAQVRDDVSKDETQLKAMGTQFLTKATATMDAEIFKIEEQQRKRLVYFWTWAVANMLALHLTGEWGEIVGVTERVLFSVFLVAIVPASYRDKVNRYALPVVMVLMVAVLVQYVLNKKKM